MRIADQMNHQRRIGMPISTKLSTTPITRNSSPIQKVLHWVGIVDPHMRDDDADQRRNSGEITEAVKHVDSECEHIVRGGGSLGFVTSLGFATRTHHGSLRCR